MKTTALATLLGAASILFGGSIALAQETSADVIRIGVVKPKVQVGTHESPSAAGSVSNILADYLRGPTMQVVLLTARLPSQYSIEAQQAGCDYILVTTLTHQRGGLTAKIGQSLGKLAYYTPYVPGASAATVVTSGVLLTAADFAASIKAKDVMRLEYELQTIEDAKPLLKDSTKRKARTDGEDLLTPVVEGAAEAVGKAVSNQS